MTEKTEPKAATFKEIVAACPGIDPKNAVDALFITDCLRDEMTAADANELYCETLQERLKSSQEANAKLTTEVSELKAAQPKGKGAPTVGTKADSKADGKASGDAASEFKAAVAVKKAAGMNHAKAVMAVNRENPQLREAMLAASN